MFESINWYKALTLKERSNSIEHVDNKCLNENERAIANRRFQQWKSKPGFKKENLFQHRLDSDKLNEEKFFFLLGENLEALAGRFTPTPKWIAELQEASSIPKTEGTNSDQKGFDSFLNALSPFIHPRQQVINQLITRLKSENPKIPVTEKVLQDFSIKSVINKLKHQVIPRTLVSKMKNFRDKGMLTGATPQERFEFFIKKISTPSSSMDLLQEFPVLARQILVYLDNWVESSLLFINHLFADWLDVLDTFFPGQNAATITSFKMLGDDHRRGAVTKVELSSGAKIIYKPKSLGIDVKFQKLLNWFNEQGHQPDFKISNILDKGDHGWAEFLETASCNSIQEVERFYKRQGNNLALLYSLSTSDIHFENIIATGEYPVVVDLEMLFCQSIPFRKNISQQEFLHKLTISQMLDDSVLSVGLVPGLDYGDETNYKGIDLSGLGGEPGQSFPGVATWINTETDEMELVYKSAEVTQGFSNLPYLDGKQMKASSFLNQILDGFKYTYRFILEYKSLLLSENGIISNFEGECVRTIVRPTAIYSVLLDESYNPNLLRNALARDWFFDYLWMDRKHFDPELTMWLIDSELTDLHDGIIPHFTTYTDSKDLWNSKEEKLKDAFPVTAFEKVVERINNLNNQEMEKQCWLIQASFAAKESNKDENKIKYLQLKDHVSSGRHHIEQKLLENAKVIGDKLLSTAIHSNDYTSWLTLDIKDSGKFKFTSAPVELYEGICGIALFLAYLGYSTNCDTYTTLAHRAIRILDCDFWYQKIDKIGVFDGFGSVVYMLSHLSTLWNDESLITKAEEIASKILQLIEKDRYYDVMLGSAGSILALLTLYKVSQSKNTLDIAVKCGNHLVSNAQKQSQGVGWLVINSSPPLSGFSHGAAGIAYALLYLGNLTNDSTFIETAKEAIKYERSLFVEEVGNWLDLRESKRNFMNAWCHGAVGIGFARLQCFDFISDKTIKKEVQIAIENTLKDRISINTSLCHGGLGNVDFLIEASKKAWFPQKNFLEQFKYSLLDKIESEGIECLTISDIGIEIPSLMTGMVGAGYQLLRLAKPDLVPSVLCLAPPVL